ncbi:MAG: J domain-containing protein [Aggregatilineales bacterium]
MRFYTYGVGAQLVRELELAGVVARILHDGNDLIHLELTGGEHVMVYLIERTIPAYEIKHIFLDNTRKGFYTLFILWGEMLLPEDGQFHTPADWLETILTIYQNTIYTYEIYMGYLFLYPVHFDAYASPNVRRIRYGEPLDVGTMTCHTHRSRIHTREDAWRIAAFDGDNHTARTRVDAHTAQVQRLFTQLAPQYALFELQPTVNRVEIKSAYRKLARIYHPDLNALPSAKDKMQQLNSAYATMMRALDDLLNPND